MNSPNEMANVLPAQEDFDAINQTTLDYIEGWFNGDVERMRRSLHPDLVKRTVVHDYQSEKWQVWHSTTKQKLVGYTEDGGGTDVPEAERVYQITVLDVFRHMATVKCVSPSFVDYLHLAKIEDKKWLIVNVLWEMRQGEYKPA